MGEGEDKMNDEFRAFMAQQAKMNTFLMSLLRQKTTAHPGWCFFFCLFLFFCFCLFSLCLALAVGIGIDIYIYIGIGIRRWHLVLALAVGS